ncbi:hypothetical protein GCM10010145_24030 [Streptomyces ruber]|uniref:Uncharacterized protein n=2 Tax=Streptomyces TaxID=1883 RepID=A0A918BBN1_9ACTN|nr:hypothetical protein GCM10010145_24030 [Streptomyces ruber]
MSDPVYGDDRDGGWPEKRVEEVGGSVRGRVVSTQSPCVLPVSVADTDDVKALLSCPDPRPARRKGKSPRNCRVCGGWLTH